MSEQIVKLRIEVEELTVKMKEIYYKGDIEKNP